MNDALMIQLYEYMKSLYDGVIQNASAIKVVEEVSQTAARTSMSIAVQMKILVDLCINSFTIFEKEITSLSNTQSVILDSLQVLNQSVLYSLLLGIFNTAAILILLCIIIVLNKK